jgi:hypothetical protein
MDGFHLHPAVTGYQTDENCIDLMNRFGAGWIRIVKNPSPAVRTAAVNKHGCALEFIKEQDEALCLLAVSNSARALEFVQNQTEKIILTAVSRYGRSLRYARKQTPAIREAALKNDPTASEFIVEDATT